jgi:hypothetical protein
VVVEHLDWLAANIDSLPSGHARHAWIPLRPGFPGPEPRLAASMWSIQMEAYGGPAQPSPTIAQCLNGGYGWQRAIPLGFEVRNGSATLQVRAVCNLYSITKNQAASPAKRTRERRDRLKGHPQEGQ